MKNKEVTAFKAVRTELSNLLKKDIVSVEAILEADCPVVYRLLRRVIQDYRSGRMKDIIVIELSRDGAKALRSSIIDPDFMYGILSRMSDNIRSGDYTHYCSAELSRDRNSRSRKDNNGISGAWA